MRRSRISSRSLSVAAAILCGCVAASVTASTGAASSRHAARAYRVATYATRATIPLRTAIADPFAFVGSQYSTAFTMTRAAGATYVRISAPWSGVAPGNNYTGFVPTDPDLYAWSWLDSVIGSAEAAGLTPILQIGYAPTWALETTASGKPTGTPDPKALGDFATALATHYDGLDGAPAVHIFQVWNEPNLSLDMSPVNVTAYRAMVNAVATAVHAVDPANLVIAGGLDPFGHKPVGKTKWYSQAPLSFMRELLCISKGSHPHRTCSAKTHLDIWSHHPYTFGGPFAKARGVDDVSLGDLSTMTAVLNAARRLHTVVSARPVQFWVTEIGWDSSPPRPHAAPMALAARWAAESLYQLWRSGISLATWFDLQDQKSPSTYQSGLYFYAKDLAKARAKPVRTAFRFPFVAYLGTHTVSVWGRDATSEKTTVTIQRRTGARGRWATVARVETNRWGIFKAAIKMAATSKDWLQASAQGSGKSIPFSLTVPKPKRTYGPWGN